MNCSAKNTEYVVTYLQCNLLEDAVRELTIRHSAVYERAFPTGFELGLDYINLLLAKRHAQDI